MPTRMVSAIASGEPPHSHDEVGEVGEALAALGVAAVAGGAIVAEQRAAGLPHGRHQARVGLDLGEALARRSGRSSPSDRPSPASPTAVTSCAVVAPSRPLV